MCFELPSFKQTLPNV